MSTSQLKCTQSARETEKELTALTKKLIDIAWAMLLLFSHFRAFAASPTALQNVPGSIP